MKAYNEEMAKEIINILIAKRINMMKDDLYKDEILALLKAEQYKIDLYDYDTIKRACEIYIRFTKKPDYELILKAALFNLTEYEQLFESIEEENFNL